MTEMKTTIPMMITIIIIIIFSDWKHNQLHFNNSCHQLVAISIATGSHHHGYHIAFAINHRSKNHHHKHHCVIKTVDITALKIPFFTAILADAIVTTTIAAITLAPNLYTGATQM